jgi:hypothetical protein
MRSGQAQRARISCKNLRQNFAAKSSFKAAQNPLKKCQKTKKPPSQNPRDKILPANFLSVKSLWMGRDLDSRQIFRAKFTQKSALNLQNLS